LVLFEQDQQVRVVTYKMFKYLRIHLTEIEVVDVRMATHQKVFSHRILLVACYIIKNKNRIWMRLARWNDATVVGEHKVADFIDRRKFLRYWLILWLLQRFWVDVHVLETYAIRTLDQAYENIGFTAIRQVAVLAFLHAASHYLRFRITIL